MVAVALGPRRLGRGSRGRNQCSSFDACLNAGGQLLRYVHSQLSASSLRAGAPVLRALLHAAVSAAKAVRLAAQLQSGEQLAPPELLRLGQSDGLLLLMLDPVVLAAVPDCLDLSIPDMQRCAPHLPTSRCSWALAYPFCLVPSAPPLIARLPRAYCSLPCEGPAHTLARLLRPLVQACGRSAVGDGGCSHRSCCTAAGRQRPGYLHPLLLEAMALLSAGRRQVGAGGHRAAQHCGSGGDGETAAAGVRNHTLAHLVYLVYMYALYSRSFSPC